MKIKLMLNVSLKIGEKKMQVNLSSDNYYIISNGTSFLFGKDKDLTIEITADNGFQFTIAIEFKEEESGIYRIDKKNSENKIQLLCFNFEESGVGMREPVQIGTIEGKKMYLIFWSHLDGEYGKKVRSVQYTIFLEK